MSGMGMGMSLGMGMGADMGLGPGLGMGNGLEQHSMGFSMSASLQGVQSDHLGLNVPAVSTGRGRGMLVPSWIRTAEGRESEISCANWSSFWSICLSIVMMQLALCKSSSAFAGAGRL